MFSIILFFPRNKENVQLSFVLSYLITFLLSAFDILKTKELIIIFIIATFILFELFSDETKITIITKIRYKAMDYIYMMLFEYKFFYFLLIILISSNSFKNLISFLTYINEETINVLSLLVGGIILLIISSNILSQKYKVFSFNRFYNNLNKICRFDEFREKYGKMRDDRFGGLILLEDKDYYKREGKFNNLYREYIFKKISFYFKQFLHSENKKNTVIRFIKIIKRGHSTIEMQIIRTLGIENGYKNVFKRKIFEFIFSQIYLKSLETHYKSLGCPSGYFKDYLLYIYINIAPTFVSGYMFSNMMRMFNKSIDKLSVEEVFVGTLCYSGRIDIFNEQDILEIYEDEIQQLDARPDDIISVIKNTKELTYYYESIELSREVYIDRTELTNEVMLVIEYTNLSLKGFKKMENQFIRRFPCVEILYADKKKIHIGFRTVALFEKINHKVLSFINDYVTVINKYVE